MEENKVKEITSEKEQSDNESLPEEQKETAAKRFKEEEGGDIPVSQKKRRKKKKKFRPKKKLIKNYHGFLSKKAERKQPLHPIERCFLANRWLQTYHKDDSVLLFRLLQQHFKEKENAEYKYERDTSDLPHDFSSTKGVPAKISKINKKYYEKRYYLFSRYDEGIELDEESMLFFFTITNTI